MALRAVIDHPKFVSLKVELKQPRGSTLGWLECIWHFTGRFTPQGNIGKYPDKQIEEWVEWNGTPGALISALVRTGWVDEDTEERLLIHDWSKHADKATKNLLNRNKLYFCIPHVRTKGTHGGIISRLPVPEPVPEPGPDKDSCAEPKQVRSAPPPTGVFMLPLVDGTDYWLQQDLYSEYVKSYPAVSVMGELGKMRAWLISNQTKRKTRRGITKYMNSWLSREQDRGPKQSGAQFQRQGELSGENRRGPTSERLTRNRIALANALAKRGVSGPWDVAREGSTPLAEPRTRANDLGVSGGLRASGPEILPPESRGGA